ncbi:tRNA (adenosine(37)-N6)-dimethylallyltransferase MiaA, partial [candidate division NPL-UPA2 bacterium]|nr:tRNA (adenosine(37)-N6)-dimethylallyltransferase MiaA [candidate division NPL-UPA2 bacterium]
LVGGSGLYLKAVVDGLFCGPKASAERREGLKKEAESLGTASLHQRLKRVDPQAASKIHPHDLVRIIRALEVYEETGKCISSLQSQKEANREIRCLMIGLERDRKDLYRRIDQRVESMFSRGLVEEVKSLLKRGYDENLTSMQGLGYKEVCGYLKGDYDVDEAKRLLKRNTRRYAKRQLTWFRKDKRIHWIKVNEDEKEILRKIKKSLVNTGLTM